MRSGAITWCWPATDGRSTLARRTPARYTPGCRRPRCFCPPLPNSMDWRCTPDRRFQPLDLRDSRLKVGASRVAEHDASPFFALPGVIWASPARSAAAPNPPQSAGATPPGLIPPGTRMALSVASHDQRKPLFSSPAASTPGDLPCRGPSAGVLPAIACPSTMASVTGPDRRHRRRPRLGQPRTSRPGPGTRAPIRGSALTDASIAVPPLE